MRETTSSACHLVIVELSWKRSVDEAEAAMSTCTLVFPAFVSQFLITVDKHNASSSIPKVAGNKESYMQRM